MASFLNCRCTGLCRVILVTLVVLASVLPLVAAPLPSPPAAGSPTGLYLVRFAEPPLARYSGGAEGLAATAPAVTGARRLDASAPASRAYLGHLRAAHDRHLAALERELGRSIPAVFRYEAVYGGVAVALAPGEASRVAALPEVIGVVADRWEASTTDAGPAWIGAEGIWDGSGTGGLPGTEGEGMVIGVIDHGINFLHPSFSDTPDDGHLFTNPYGSGNYVGWCDPTHPDHDPSYLCNDKVIGGWDYVEAVPGVTEADGPIDTNGHGSHVSSIAVGNRLTQPAISGVAPHANLIAYDTCFTGSQGQGLCSFAAAIAATNQAVLDGAHALNFSATGGTDPWGGDVDSAFLDAVAAGLFVAASAGNAGPTPATVQHYGPWVASVAATSHHRVTHTNGLTGLSGGGSPPGGLNGVSLTAGHGPAPIVYAGAFANGDPNPGQCLSPFPPGTWTAGEIVLCDRGTLARVLKCQNAAAGGAGGCVLANLSGGASDLVAEAHLVPATHVAATQGNALRSWLAGGSGHTATLTAETMVTDPAIADILGVFSSRGPNPLFDVLKPDVAAPGVGVLGALSTDWIPGFTGVEMIYFDGTSMASPHTAGAAALVAALHPGWSPTEVLSALATTGAGALGDDGITPADPFDVGAGRIDLAAAAIAGLVLDESVSDFQNADPAGGGDPRTLNLPSLVDDDCDATCGWSRRVESVASSTVVWTASVVAPPDLAVTVTPGLFTLPAGGARTLTVALSVGAGQPLGDWVFGTLVLTPNNPSVPTARLPLAIIPTAADVDIFSDGFESGDTTAWSSAVP